MPALIDRIRAAVAGQPHEFWPKIVAVGGRDGLWDAWEGLTTLRQLQEPAVAPTPPQPRLRMPPRTRRDRWEERPETPSGRFVRAMSLDPVIDWSLSDGAARCLQLVVSLAGGIGRPLITLTCSIAKQIGRTRRTVQNYWRQLAEAGFINRTFDQKTGLVTITVTEAAKPPEPPEKPRPWPRLPRPKVWRRLAGGGAQTAAHIKGTPCSYPSSLLVLVEGSETTWLGKAVVAPVTGEPVD